METDLKKKLTDDLKQALRSGDKTKVSVIRLLLAAIKNAEIARRAAIASTGSLGELAESSLAARAVLTGSSALDNAGIAGVIAKEIRQRQESIEALKKGNRPDLVAKEEANMVVFKQYLPQQMSRDEIIAEARKVIAEVGAQGPKDKGKVMPKIMAQLRGRADGREINAVVTELLSS